MEYNFRKQPKSRIDSLGTSYDYFSNMHYGKTAFGSGKVTMETTDAYYKDLIGKTYSLDDNKSMERVCDSSLCIGTLRMCAETS